MTVTRKVLTVVLICVCAIAGLAAMFDVLRLALGHPLSLAQCLIAVGVYAAVWFGLLAWGARRFGA